MTKEDIIKKKKELRDKRNMLMAKRNSCDITDPLLSLLSSQISDISKEIKKLDTIQPIDKTPPITRVITNPVEHTAKLSFSNNNSNNNSDATFLITPYVNENDSDFFLEEPVEPVVITVNNYFELIRKWKSLKDAKLCEYRNLYGDWPSKKAYKTLKKASPVIMSYCNDKKECKQYIRSLNSSSTNTELPFPIIFDETIKYSDEAKGNNLSKSAIRRTLRKAKKGISKDIKSHKNIEDILIKKKSLWPRVVALLFSATTLTGIGAVAIKNEIPQKLIESGKTAATDAYNAFPKFIDSLFVDNSPKKETFMTAEEYLEQFNKLDIYAKLAEQKPVMECKYYLGLTRELHDLGFISTTDYYEPDITVDVLKYSSRVGRSLVKCGFLEENSNGKIDWEPYMGTVTSEDENMIEKLTSFLIGQR